MTSIFDILNKNGSLKEEICRIYELFCIETVVIVNYKGYSINNFSLKSYINKYLFREWTYRGTCISLDEAIAKIGLNCEAIFWSENQCFLYLEFIINILTLFEYCGHKEKSGQIRIILENTRKILEDCNKYVKKVDDKYYVLEKDSTVTTVVDLIDDTKTAISVVAYNYTSNKGNIFEKQKILKILADDFEPRIKRLKADGRYSKLAVDLSFLFNNINIRHNNTENNQTTLDLNNTEELEKYYDMTYRRYLMAVLACEELDTKKQIEAIKK